ncbi:MAG: ABC transporter ATP-binding protein [Lentisphaeria bacterium]
MRIRIETLRKQYGTMAALDNLSLEIADGELFFLLGPSGCGKTTLLRALAGFVEPDAGRILFDGRDMTGVPTHQRRAALMFQGYALWPHLTVAENVAFGLEMLGIGRGEREARVRRALDRVRITDLAGRKPNALSGGQQQRVALARTLVVEPACLLLDEPLANLDAKLRLEMRAEIRRLCKEAGLTAVYVTHDQKEALAAADRLAVMDRGRLLQAGAPRDLYTHPATPFVAGFLGPANLLPATVAAATPEATELALPCGLRLRAGAGAGVAAGAAVTVCLRPEAIAVHEQAPAAANGFAGRLVESAYLGGMAEHTVVLDAPAGDGPALTVFETNPPPNRLPGAPVWLRFPPEHVTVLPG